MAIGGVAVLLAAAVGIGALLSRGGDEEQPEPGTTQQAPGPTDAGDLGVELSEPSPPEIRIAKASGGKVTFAWDRQQKGDTYRYQVTDLNGSTRQQWKVTDQPRAVVAALPDGNTCIQVIVVNSDHKGSTAGKKCKVTQR